MDPVKNPYTPGAGSAPTDLVGRDSEREDFDIAVQRLALGRPDRSFLLTGFRGVGKTVMLREFGRIARNRGWKYEAIEVSEELQFLEAIALALNKVLLKLSISRRLTERVKKALQMLNSLKVQYQIPGTEVTATAGFDGTQGWVGIGILSEDLADMFIEVGGIAKQSGTGVLVTIDEIQYLSQEDLAALITGLHRVSQEQLPFMVAGAGLPSLPSLAGEAKSYAERLFTFKEIGSLEHSDAHLAISLPAEKEGVTWTTEALDRVFDLTQGYPYFLQELGKHTWDAAEGPREIGVSDVENALPIVTHVLDNGFFRARLDRANNSERKYIHAMASLGAGPCNSGDVASALGKTTAQVGTIREALIKRGLIYAPKRGVLAFTVPMFDGYVIRAYGEYQGGGRG